MRLELEAWLRTTNESAADSLLEAFEELLTVHRRSGPIRLHSSPRFLSGVSAATYAARLPVGSITA